MFIYCFLCNGFFSSSLSYYILYRKLFPSTELEVFSLVAIEQLYCILIFTPKQLHPFCSSTEFALFFSFIFVY